MSTAELRRAVQNQVEPLIYVPARFVSIYVSQLLVRTPITPNSVTLSWGACLLGASILLGSGSRAQAVAAGVLIALAYVLDCVDGELARLRGKGSDVGSTLEQMVHWSTNLTVLAGAAIGLYRATGEPVYLLLGIAVLIGDASFHFMYVSLNVAASPGAHYGIGALVTRWQFHLMPINTNLVMFSALLGRVDIALWVWAVWSIGATLLVFSLFFVAESRLEKLREVFAQAVAMSSKP